MTRPRIRTCPRARSATAWLGLSLLLPVWVAGCGPSARPAVSLPPVAATAPSEEAAVQASGSASDAISALGQTALTAPTNQVPPGIHWVRTSAEYRIIFEATYAQAWVAVQRARAEAQGPWAVIIDADETLLDNSTYQLQRARQGLGYTSSSWNAWVREEAATALPGAVHFTQRVRAAGGRVAVVTNRDEEVCEPTRRNLRAVGIAFDVVLCREPGESEKDGRFERVQTGQAAEGLPPLSVVAWLGDNVGDFPGGSQELRGAASAELEGFGSRWFVFPNPMYGSWESNVDPAG